MAEDQPPTNGNSLSGMINSVADNSLMKIFARYVMPVALAVIGYLMVDKLSSIHEDSQKTQAAVVQLGTKVDNVATQSQATNTEVKVLAAQVFANRERSDARAQQVESKLQTVEQAASADRTNLERRIDEVLRAIIAKPKVSAPIN